MLECSECGEELKEGDKVFVCKICHEVFCEDCIEEHIKECIKDESYEHEAICSSCGSESPTLFDCPLCNEENLCESCFEDHIEYDHSDEYEEYDYEEYRDKKL